MSRNLISLSLSADRITVIGNFLTGLEDNLTDFISLPVAIRRSANKMGPKSEAFCRQTLLAMRQNPNIIPATVDVADGEADLEALDQLRPIFRRLQKLFERACDTELALGSDAMNVALHGYGYLKLAGKTGGLKALGKTLGERFAKSPRQRPEPAPADA
jgi:hypothetical protein